VDYKTLRPRNYSYYIDLVRTELGIPFIDLYIDPSFWWDQLQDSEAIVTKIIWIDDECITTPQGQLDRGALMLFDIIAQRHKGSIVIVKTRRIYNELTTRGVNVVYCAWLFGIDDAVSCVKSNQLAPVATANNSWKNYFCLNRNYRLHKSYTINQLRPLVHTGYVTANDVRFKRYPGLAPVDPMTDYLNFPGVGFERVCVYSQPTNEKVSSNSRNYAWLQSNINACINIVTETSTRAFFPTEKTLLPIAIGRLPIWIAETGRVQEVRDQGFDVFDDVIDHSYDTEPNPRKRIRQAINQNLNILTSSSTIEVYNSVQDRLKCNQLHFLGKWLDTTVQRLLDDIKAYI
jgi:hypothetical protein